MKPIIFIFACILSVQSFANCTYFVVPENTKISWTAFKTPKKVGVGGKFDKFSIKASEKDSLVNLLLGATFSIDSSSVNTGNPERDKKIVSNFFSKLKNKNIISGKVKSVKLKDEEHGSVGVGLSINGVEHDIDMSLVVKGTDIELRGGIDVLNFTMDKQLAKLNQACSALHEGKTWSDVEIALNATIEKKCN